MVDGNNVVPMATSQDHKRVGDGDTGPNTGGMGAYSPAPVVTDEVFKKVMEQVILPTVNGMKAEQNSYTGFLYAGLMIDGQGNPKVIEYNCRFGDPETQPIMLRMKSDLVDLCNKACDGQLAGEIAEYDTRAAVGIVLAAKNYPNSPQQREKIFQAGTSFKNGKIVTNGGRVLCATALGTTVYEAQQKAYKLAKSVNWDGMFFRNDIAYRAIAREQKK